MSYDFGNSPAFREMESYYRTLYEPGFGRVTYASGLTVSPDGEMALFSGSIHTRLEGVARQHLCAISLATGNLEVLTGDEGNALGAAWAPDCKRYAFLADFAEPGIFQPCLGTIDGGNPTPLPRVDGVAEGLVWSPDGRRLLLCVAGRGADLAGMQGATTTGTLEADVPPWAPTVRAGPGENEWRRLWLLDLESSQCLPLTSPGINVWEACWCGNERLLAVTSERPEEAAWYGAQLSLIDASTGAALAIHQPTEQIGVPAASPSGRHVAAIEAVCSDRMIMAGDVVLGAPDGALKRVDTLGVDVTHIVWRDDDRLLFIGERAFHTVAGEYSVAAGRSREIWADDELHCGFWYPAVSAVGEDECAFIAESYLHPPQLVVTRGGELETITEFSHSETAHHLATGLYGDRVEQVVWEAEDGLEIHGWLILPRGEGPFPTIMEVHGGPIWSNRSRWMGAVRAEPQALVHRGYAVFRPNPRGSGGRGQAYAAAVKGDMGGKDTGDLLSGLDHLVAKGISDPSRLGVMGVSYGGFMSSWIITQDPRFAASIPISPVTNWVSMKWTSNVPHFVDTFLDSKPMKAGGLFHARSPVNFADRVTTPTMLIAGELDRISPPAQAEEYYNALRESGVDAVYLNYPQEGHNVRNMPATIDAAARIADWFDRCLKRDTGAEP